MTLHKKVLAAAIVTGLFSANAFAVDISAATPVPTRIATEVNLVSTGTLFTNVGSALDVTSVFGYAFSDGEVRFARLECSSNVVFAAGSTVSGSNVDHAFGQINGLGSNVIFFSVTATDADLAGNGTNVLDSFTVDGDRAITAQGAASCTYGLYDQPSQAQAGGALGRIATRTGSYLSFVSSYLYDITPNTSTADVEADPAFTAFVSQAPTNSTARAQLGGVDFNTRAVITATAQPIKTDGTVTTLADILAATSAHRVDGDFSAAANANGTFTGAALSRVFFSVNGDCSTVDTAATAVTATSASFVTGAAALGGFFCYTPNGATAIPASEYTIALVPVSNAGFTAGTLGPSFLGDIVRNGTELQAPLAQIPDGWLSRLVLTNTGNADRPFTVDVLTETGNSFTGDPVTGTVPANGTVVVSLAAEEGQPGALSFSGRPRGTLNVTIAGPNAQIQGLYQIVNPAAGSISNHVMVRPGTN